ncbi:BTB/POZ and MATH domain-containing protein 2-like [Triticum dicoccoides]|nr:BTB/POZ and MATH domain-containing protein 2-like [Triticum dicoccoides]XP_037469716.1 BTB/POZ and MATH domain-containing protein 2-like [Triticum dicoccoides]
MFRIDGQLRKMAANGAKVRSGTFRVGGHEWRLVCYPNGNGKEYEGYMSLFLEHASHASTGDATAKAQLSILDQAWKPSYTRDISKTRFFSSNLSWGTRGFLKHDDLDALTKKHLNLKDDCLTILCDVTVTVAELHTEEDHVEDAPPVAPPFGLPGQLAEAVWSKKGVDVQIEVGGETLPAHRGILEAGSPVFKADLSLASPTAGATALLRVEDMDAEVFKALLQFIYTDSPPVILSASMAERLLVAADRYKLEELKLVCEDALCWHVDMSSVAVSLALAEKHDCSALRAACIQFLSCPGNLESFMASDGFEKVRTCCPSALMDLVLKKITTV